MKMEKEFSKGFMDDIQDLIEICIENDMNSVTITAPFGDVDLGIEINFFAKSGKVKIKEECAQNE